MRIATTHINADLDGLAALVALDLLEGPLTLVLPGGTDPAAGRVWREQGERLRTLTPLAAARERLAAEPLEALFVVDTARPERLGDLAPLAKRAGQVLAWDTHPPAAGDVPRAVIPDAGAVTSALVLLLAERGVEPSPEEAGLLLLGIHADTGHLRYNGTTPADHRAAALCLEWGAPLAWLERYLPLGLDARALELMSRMAAAAEVLEIEGRAVALLRLDIERYEPDLAVLLGHLRAAEGWPAAFLLAADPSRITVIGRSDGSLDTGAALRRLGGGGHPEASSASLRGSTLLEVRGRLLAALERSAEPPTARELASSPIFFLPSTTTIQQAADALHRYRVNALPIVQGASYVGVVSRREVDDALRHGLGGEPALAISPGEPPWIAPEADVDAMRGALLASPSRLLLVGQPPDRALGVVTRTAVFRARSADPPLVTSGSPPEADRLWAKARAGLGARADAVEQLGALAQERGTAALLVGGCVRDLLLARAARDVDVVVQGDAPALAEAAAARLGGRVHTHSAFGTAHWVLDDEGEGIDLASARTESYAVVGALPDVVPAALRQDLYRRDFTLNMMAIDVTPARRGQLVDPFGGRADLEQGLLRVAHGLSFYDDPTRAWRAARFAARFDFRLAPGTAALLQEALRVGALERVSDERLGAELHRLLEEPAVVTALSLLREWGLLKRVHPALSGDRELLHRAGAVREAWAALHALDPLSHPGPGEALWIALGWGLSSGDRRAMERLVSGVRGRAKRWIAGPGRVKGALKQLASAGSRGAQAAALADLEPAELICALAEAEDGAPVLWWVGEGHAIKPAIDGHTLMAAGVAPGPRLGRALVAARAAAWDGADAAAQLAAALAVP